MSRRRQSEVYKGRSAKSEQRGGLHTRPQQSRPRPAPGESMSAHLQPHHSGEATAMETVADRAATNPAIPGRRDVSGHSFEENLRHHSLVFVIEEMAVKDGHASDYGVGEVHNDVDRTAVRNIYGVQPQRGGNRLIVFGVSQEMDLMDMHRMQFTRRIYDPPMLK